MTSTNASSPMKIRSILSAVTEAPRGQNGTHCIAASAVAPAVNAGDHGNQAENAREIGEDDRQLDRARVTPLLRIMAIAQQQQTAQRRRYPALLCRANRRTQITRLVTHTEDVARDGPVGRRRHEARGMGVLIEL